MNKLRYSPDALNDLDEIWAYIHKELQNPSAAQKTVAEILDSTERLRTFSEMEPLLSTIMEVESDYRFLASGNYIVFYRIEGAFVSVDRILYGRPDFIRVLFHALPED